MTNLYKYIDVIERKVIPDCKRHFLMVEDIPIGYCPVSFIWKSEDDFQEAKLNEIDWLETRQILAPFRICDQ